METKQKEIKSYIKHNLTYFKPSNSQFEALESFCEFYQSFGVEVEVGQLLRSEAVLMLQRKHLRPEVSLKN